MKPFQEILDKKLKSAEKMQEQYEGHKKYLIDNIKENHRQLIQFYNDKDDKKIIAESVILKNQMSSKRNVLLHMFNGYSFMKTTDLQMAKECAVFVGTEKEIFKLRTDLDLEMIGIYDEEMNNYWLKAYNEVEGAIMIKLK